jgi:hypothetical protein
MGNDERRSGPGGVLVDEPAWVNGPNLAGMLLREQFVEVVSTVDELSDSELWYRLDVLESRARSIEAERAVLLDVLERRKAYRADGHAGLVGKLRAGVRWSKAESRCRTQLARLVAAHPAVGERLHDGVLPIANAHALARTFANPRVRAEFDLAVGNLLTIAIHWEHDDFRLKLAEWEAAADADGAHRERAVGHQGRCASLTEFDGTGTLFASWGDADTALNREVFDRFVQAEWDADWKWTRATHGDDATPALMPRTDAQRRADALTAIFRRAGSVEPGGKAPRIVVNIHLDFATWVELMTRAGVFPEQSTDPFDRTPPLPEHRRCSTQDGQPIDPIRALRASIEGHVRFVITNDEGVPIRWGRERRLFTGPARQAVMSLLHRCTFPGCRVPSSKCQADHLDEWATGGLTEPGNGGPECGRHNRFRNRGFRSVRDRWGWHMFRPDGTEIC